MFGGPEVFWHNSAATGGAVTLGAYEKKQWQASSGVQRMFEVRKQQKPQLLGGQSCV
jgi:hypothetical protein